MKELWKQGIALKKGIEIWAVTGATELSSVCGSAIVI